MVRFREVREAKREIREDLGFDPDKRIVVDERERRVQEIIREAQRQADEAWNNTMVDILIMG